MTDTIDLPPGMDARSPTKMEDVARLAGVSVITVSRVLREPHKVADGTRRRVTSAIKQIGYVPNLVARSLKSQRSGFIAAIIPSITHSIVAEVTRGMSEILHEQKVQLLLGDSGFSPDEEEALVASFLARRPDAIYLTGTTHSSGTRRMLEAARIPVIETGNLTKTPIDMVVGYSNFEAAREITRAMISRGRRKIGYIGQTGRKFVDRVHDRHCGYGAAIKGGKLRSDKALQVEVELSFRGGAEGFSRLLQQTPDIDAVFCTSDIIAVGVLFEAQRRGVSVPRQIAIAGMDDQEIARECVPSLSTIRMPRYEMGRRAAQMLCQRLEGSPVTEKIVDLGFEIVLRETT
jgi:LacI family gluconate utilization system Gnt-I transcriptional repressor